MNYGFKSSSVQNETEDGVNLRLTQDLVFVRRDGSTIRNRAGSMTDGMSAPQVTKLIPWMSDLCKKAFRPAIVHDGAFRVSLDILTPAGHWMPIPMATMDERWCDDLIRECMESVGCNEIEIHIVFTALQEFGWRAFSEDRKTK